MTKASNNEIYKKVSELINGEIGSLVSIDGGKIELISFSEGIVKVSLKGTCKHCNAREYTIRNVVERILFDKLPEYIDKVELI